MHLNTYWLAQQSEHYKYNIRFTCLIPASQYLFFPFIYNTPAIPFSRRPHSLLIRYGSGGLFIGPWDWLTVLIIQGHSKTITFNLLPGTRMEFTVLMDKKYHYKNDFRVITTCRAANIFSLAPFFFLLYSLHHHHLSPTPSSKSLPAHSPGILLLNTVRVSLSGR